MPTLASTKATTAKKARFYPLQSWREASEGFPMVDVYRWWTPKLGAGAENFNLLEHWHTCALPSVDLLNQWHQDSLHAQAIDLPELWRELSVDMQAADLLVHWQKESRPQLSNVFSRWRRSQPRAPGLRRVNQLRDWRSHAGHAKESLFESWNASRARSLEIGQWQWTNELSASR